jgi:hypothetical protein
MSHLCRLQACHKALKSGQRQQRAQGRGRAGSQATQPSQAATQGTQGMQASQQQQEAEDEQQVVAGCLLPFTWLPFSYDVQAWAKASRSSDVRRHFQAAVVDFRVGGRG